MSDKIRIIQKLQQEAILRAKVKHIVVLLTLEDTQLIIVLVFNIAIDIAILVNNYRPWVPLLSLSILDEPAKNGYKSIIYKS